MEDTATTSRVDGVYWVPTDALPPLSTKIARLQKRAAKLGSLPITFDITGEREKRVVGYEIEDGEDQFGRLIKTRMEVIREYAKVVVKGEAPKFNGWRLVARLLHPDQSGSAVANVISEVPGETCPKSFRTVGSKCDHCKKNWIQRRDTYVVASEAGEYKQVGSNCIADFLGHQNPELVAGVYEFYSTLDTQFAMGEDEDGDYEGHFMRGTRFLSTDGALTWAVAVHRVWGWTSRAAAAALENKTPSVVFVQRAMLGNDKEAAQIRKDLSPTDADREYAATCRAWAKTLDVNSDDTYLANLSVLANSDTVSVRTIGFACSIIGAYKRQVEKVEREKKNRAETQHVGNVGDKLVLDLRVVIVRSFEGDYGPRHMNRFADDAGNTLIWWTGTRAFEEGATVRLQGTVKKHGEWKGYKQTELTRCKELPNDEQAAVLASLSAAAETLASYETWDETSHKKGIEVASQAMTNDRIPADEYEAAVAELENRGWIVDGEKQAYDYSGGTPGLKTYAIKKWQVDADTARTLQFAKARKSAAQKRAEQKAKRDAKAAAK